jgi:chromosome segregation ATPase
MKIDLAGKIFIVLIFLMSLVFASFAIMHYTSHRNWRDEILRKPADVRGNQQPGLKYRLEQAYLENDRLKKEREQYEKQLDTETKAKLQALAKAEAMINTLRAESAAKFEQLRTKETELAAKTKDLNDHEVNLSALTAEVDKLRAEIAAAEKTTNQQIARATALTNELAQSSGEFATLKERNEQLATDVKNAEQLKQEDKKPESP